MVSKEKLGVLTLLGHYGNEAVFDKDTPLIRYMNSVHFYCFWQVKSSKNFRKDVIEVEMKLGDNSQVVARVMIYRDHGFESDLEVLTRPDDARVNCAVVRPPAPRFSGVCRENSTRGIMWSKGAFSPISLTCSCR